MSHGTLLLIAAAGVALLLVLVLKFKIQPFVALLVVSIGVALAAGVPAGELVKTIEDGMGSTLGHISLIIALGAMIGRIVELSGGAAALAHSLMRRFGERRTPLALTVAGFLLGIPVFFEVGLIILMPLAYGVARGSRRPLLVYALPMGAAMLAVHAFLPPHPGPVAAAQLLGASQGEVLLYGLPIVAVVTFAGYLIAARMTRHSYPMAPEIEAEVFGNAGPEGPDGSAPVAPATGTSGGSLTAVRTKPETPPVTAAPAEAPPSFGLVLAMIVTPIALILLGAVGENTLEDGSLLRAVLDVVGAPLVALIIALGLCAYLLGVRRGWSSRHISEVMTSAMPPVAAVILVAGAGGVFGKVLVASGIGGAVADLLRSTGLPVLVLAFLMTLLMRAVQGSATVALVTVAGLIAPLVKTAALSPAQTALIAVAMGAGALALSHINDAGYWMFSRLVGLDVGAALRTWTVLTTVMGLIGFVLTGLVWPLT
ncbi:SLC13 family permease [Spirillospora sp. CA-142024]|uniref:GntT/GntP/DsdX family permease n=1 Tax=Spirillospora sp. CA-142024 TaxID=3240036 RepID=UPI003D908A70